MKNFLVPVDFSEASRNAARYAISLGEVLKAKIVFVNVVPIGLLIEDESLHSRIAAQAQLVESNKDFLSKDIIALSKKSFGFDGRLRGRRPGTGNDFTDGA